MNETADDTSRILTQADALMNRHRSHRVFVARSETESAPAEAAAAPIDDDFPVLTEVVTDMATEVGTNNAGDSLGRQTQQIESALEHWLDKRLPDEVLRVMDGVSDQLISTLVTRMRAELLPQLMSSLKPDQNERDTAQDRDD